MSTIYSVVVTFEFDARPPETVRLDVVAGGPATAASRGIRQARQNLKPRSWSSVVALVNRPSAKKRAAA